MTQSRFGSLDGLRALAVLSVVAFHSSRGTLWTSGAVGMLVTNAVERAAPALPLSLKFPIVAGLTWAAAWVSFHTYEAWFIRRKAKFMALPP